MVALFVAVTLDSLGFASKFVPETKGPLPSKNSKPTSGQKT
jgi:hypothetical protein